MPPTLVAEQGARLIREARALAAVLHPGVVDVLDGGVLEDGSPFVVLEKLDGRTLEGLIAARGKLPREEAVAVGLQLCEALDALHRAGIVHRDVKPDNVFVVRDRDGAERLKLLDFGIARVDAPGEDKLTKVGALIGTPEYMSPEQLRGTEIDHRTDIYALGVTLFECLTGRVPYEGDPRTVMLRVCSANPRTPSVTDFVPDVGRELSEVVARAISIEPDGRFSSALDFGRALYAALPSARSRTFFLGPPPAPKFGPSPPRPQARVEQRRRFPRAPYVTPVRLEHERGSIDARSEDISRAGLMVITREPLDAGGLTTVRFALPMGRQAVSCLAHVRWVRAARPGEPDGPHAVGLEFADGTEEMRACISTYVALMGEV